MFKEKVTSFITAEEAAAGQNSENPASIKKKNINADIN